MILRYCKLIPKGTLRLPVQCLRIRHASTSTAAQMSSPENPEPSAIPDEASDNQHPISRKLIDTYAAFMVPTYARPKMVLSRGAGLKVYDVDGNEYIDFTAGIAVTALGHSDKGVAEVVNRQASQLIHTSNLYFTREIGQLSKSLVEKTKASGGMKDVARAFLSNSGTEANEAALKFAKKYGSVYGNGRKTEIVSFINSFHGRTMGALSATPNPKYQSPFLPLVPGFKYAPFNSTEGLEKIITQDTCGVIVEPIQGEGGIWEAHPDFLSSLRQRCDEVNALLIYDEIQCGMGRTGDLWAHCKYSPKLHPDILTTAKALGNGLPIGATLITERVSETIKIGDHGTTFGGNSLACSVASYVLDEITKKELRSKVSERSSMLVSLVEQMMKVYPDYVLGIRGRGLLLGIQLAEDPGPLMNEARRRGLLVISAGKNTLRLVPALKGDDVDFKAGVQRLRESFVAVAETMR